jgi:hypothetical protein
VLQFAAARVINMHRSDAQAFSGRRYNVVVQSAFHRRREAFAHFLTPFFGDGITIAMDDCKVF